MADLADYSTGQRIDSAEVVDGKLTFKAPDDKIIERDLRGDAMKSKMVEVYAKNRDFNFF